MPRVCSASIDDQSCCPGAVCLAIWECASKPSQNEGVNLVLIAIPGMLQAYYLAAPFPIERADTVAVPGLRRASGSVTISQLSGYAVSSRHLTPCSTCTPRIDHYLWRADGVADVALMSLRPPSLTLHDC